MSPEYGATMGFFPVDDVTLDYLRRPAAPTTRSQLAETYCKENHLFRTDDAPSPTFTKVVELDLATVEPSLAGPKRPQDRVPLSRMKESFNEALKADGRPAGLRPRRAKRAREHGHGAEQRPLDRDHARRRGDRGDHQLHEHQQPERDGRRRPRGQEGGRERPQGEAVRQDVDRARLARRDRLLREVGPRRGTREGRLPHGRLRLHDLHRQLGPAPRAGRQRGGRGRPDRLRRAVGQPQLRGPDQPAR